MITRHETIAYLRHYTDYKITSENGKLVRTVHNANGTSLEGSKWVQLPVGTYCIVARANGYGVVTVLVVIRAGQITTVHLEGDPTWQDRALLRQTRADLPASDTRRASLKNPARANRTPGSMRGAPGNRCPHLDAISNGLGVSCSLTALMFVLLCDVMVAQLYTAAYLSPSSPLSLNAEC